MPEAILVGDGVIVPAEAIETRAVRASGPGGQNVNKVASKIELRVDLGRIHGMDTASRERLGRIVARRLDSEGKLVVTSQRTRDQHRNLEDARAKIRDWIALALIPEKKRHPTRPGAGARERRLQQKRHKSRIKQHRRLSGQIENEK
jgi:ribosome-associated protein